jgi:DNA-binding MarR family transcriptional regulator
MDIKKEIVQKKFIDEYQKLSINIIFTSAWLSSFINDSFKKHNITSQQFNVLRILRGQYPNGINIKTIKARMIDKNSDVSRILDKLIKKDLIMKSVSVDDKRNVEIIISQKGLNLLKETDYIDQMHKNIHSNLSETEAKALNAMLDKLRK